MTVRSHRLFGPHALAGTGIESLIDVPSGEIWILKSLRVVNTGSAATVFDLGLDPLDTDTALFWRTAIDAAFVLVDIGWQVLEPGDGLRVRGDDATLTLWGSGARLAT